MDPTARLRATLSHRYRIEGEIGRGGMDLVYPARVEELMRPKG